MQIKLKMIIVTLMTIIAEPTDGNGRPAEKQRIYVKVDCEMMMMVVMQISVIGVMMSTWWSKGV